MNSQQLPSPTAVPTDHRAVAPSVCPPVIEETPAGLRIDSAVPPPNGSLFGAATPAMAQALPQGSQRHEANAIMLRQAGYMSPSAAVDFAALRYALTIGSVILLGIALVMVQAWWEPFVLGALVTVPFLLWLVPASIVERQAAARIEQIAKGVPDLMSLTGICVQQGMSVPEAFHRAAGDLAEAYPAIAQEAAIVDVEARVSTFANALRSFRDRIDVPEVNSLASVLIQSSELGTGVSESLEKNSHTVRQLHRERSQTRARLVPQKIITPTLFFLIPAALLVFNAPAIVEYFAPLDDAIINSSIGR